MSLLFENSPTKKSSATPGRQKRKAPLSEDSDSSLGPNHNDFGPILPQNECNGSGDEDDNTKVGVAKRCRVTLAERKRSKYNVDDDNFEVPVHSNETQHCKVLSVCQDPSNEVSATQQIGNKHNVFTIPGQQYEHMFTKPIKPNSTDPYTILVCRSGSQVYRLGFNDKKMHKIHKQVVVNDVTSGQSTLVNSTEKVIQVELSNEVPSGHSNNSSSDVAGNQSIHPTFASPSSSDQYISTSTSSSHHQSSMFPQQQPSMFLQQQPQNKILHSSYYILIWM